MERKSRLRVERLEDRRTPANFGIAWPDPRHLTVSFAPDQTPITGAKSSLFATLNAQQPTATWQRDVLRAVQTWASVANIDVGLVADRGSAFGSTEVGGGALSFGSIRVGGL